MKLHHCLAFAFVVCGSSLTTHASAEDSTADVQPSELSAKLAIPLSASSGVLSAGTLCLPKGKSHVSDFVTSEVEFRRFAADAYLEVVQGAAGDSAKNLEVKLTGIEAKLCAKGYGMFGLGDRRSHSGKANFTFETTLLRSDGNLLTSRKLILLKIDGKNPQPLSALLPQALKDLFSELRSDLAKPQSS